MFTSSALFILASLDAGLNITDVDVPSVLLQVTAPLELSGIAWDPTALRYLAISDDTGLKSLKTNHAPILFSINEKGLMDVNVIHINNLDTLDDAESIAPGPNGTVLLVTSHSPNLEGEIKSRRRQLLLLKPEKNDFTVVATLDLLKVKNAQKQSLSQMALGATAKSKDEPIDIEALTFQSGSLFIGLKAPLDVAGHACIVEIKHIEEGFKNGKIERVNVSVWARPLLQVENKSRTLASQGVTDMIFLPDGSLVLLGNAPKMKTPDDGGAMWLMKDANAKPQLLHRFLGLKPEGITLSPQGLSVVFDRGMEKPQWTHVPLPH
jgi:Protein of unknown function (DUF3616)